MHIPTPTTRVGAHCQTVAIWAPVFERFRSNKHQTHTFEHQRTSCEFRNECETNTYEREQCTTPDGCLGCLFYATVVLNAPRLIQRRAALKNTIE